MTTRKMTVDELLDYVARFNGMDFSKDQQEEGTAVYNKLTKLLKKAGFEFYTVTCGNIAHYRLASEDVKHQYTQVRIGLRPKKKQYGRGRNAKYHVVAYKGFVEVERDVMPALNPDTGDPWKIGDVDVRHPLLPILTKNGWYSGD